MEALDISWDDLDPKEKSQPLTKVGPEGANLKLPHFTVCKGSQRHESIEDVGARMEPAQCPRSQRREKPVPPVETRGWGQENLHRRSDLSAKPWPQPPGLVLGQDSCEAQ